MTSDGRFQPKAFCDSMNHLSNDLKGKYAIYLSWMMCFHQQMVRTIYVQRSCSILYFFWRSQLNMKGLIWEIVRMTKWFIFAFQKIGGQCSSPYTFFRLVQKCDTGQYSVLPLTGIVLGFHISVWFGHWGFCLVEEKRTKSSGESTLCFWKLKFWGIFWHASDLWNILLLFIGVYEGPDACVGWCEGEILRFNMSERCGCSLPPFLTASLNMQPIYSV